MHRVNAVVVGGRSRRCVKDRGGEESLFASESEGPKVRWHLSRKHEGSGDISMETSGTRAFQAEERSRAKALRPENAQCVQDKMRRPMWADPRDHLLGWGWEESIRGEADTEPWQVMRGGFWAEHDCPLTPPLSAALKDCLWFASVQFSHSVMSDSLWPHELQHTRPPCPSPTHVH